MNAQLVCRMRGGKSLTLDVPVGEAVLGRDKEATVAIPMDGVSRQHARIVFEGESYFLEDLKSTNGTFLNGSPLPATVRERLHHLDVIGLGREAELLFLMREKATVVPTKQQAIVRATLLPEEGESGEYEIATGEVTIGRSTAANIVVDRRAISKLHVRIQRGTDQLVIQDLGSVNGTFVNGARVMTALLQDNDRVSLANVMAYRVRITWGEVTSTSGARRAIPIEALNKDESISTMRREWRTRYEWDSAERAALDAARVDSDVPKPAAKPKPAAPTPAPAAKPASVPAAAKATMMNPAPPKPAPAPVDSGPIVKPIREVHLNGSGFDFSVTEPGTYDIGRADNARLRVAHPTVSRQQCRLILAADRMTAEIEHAGNTTPTMLNGAVVARRAVLGEGAKILIGEIALTVSIKR